MSEQPATPASDPPAPPVVSPDGRFFLRDGQWVPMPAESPAPPSAATPAPRLWADAPAPARTSHAGRNILLLIGVVVAILVIAALASGNSSPVPGISHTVYIQLGEGSGAIYLASDNLDPKSWTDDATSHKVSGLPNGASKFCTYTVSQGVTYQVWATGSAESSSLARAACARYGQRV